MTPIDPQSTVSQSTVGNTLSFGKNIESVNREWQSFSNINSHNNGRDLEVRNIQSSIIKELDNYILRWQKIRSVSEKKISLLPSSARSLVELQIQVNNLGVTSQLLVQSAETISGTIRRLQQMGN